MTNDVRNDGLTRPEAEIAQQLALASTMTLAIHRVQAAQLHYEEDCRAAADREARTVAQAAENFAREAAVALGEYHQARETLLGGAQPDPDDE